MKTWTTKKDGWTYCEDGLQRFKRRADGSLDVESVPQGETLTQQQFIDDCDVNIILNRILKTNEMPALVPALLEGDFSQLPSYQEALHTIQHANELFMEIPASTRLRFENDPQKLMDFLADENNNEEAIKLQLKIPKPQPLPDPQTELLSQIAKNTSKSKSKTSTSPSQSD